MRLKGQADGGDRSRSARADPHRVAVNQLGVEVAQRTAPARPTGNGQLVEWARSLDAERVWAIKDVRKVAGSMKRFLNDRGEVVVRLAPLLMPALVRVRGRVASLI